MGGPGTRERSRPASARRTRPLPAAPTGRPLPPALPGSTARAPLPAAAAEARHGASLPRRLCESNRAATPAPVNRRPVAEQPLRAAPASGPCTRPRSLRSRLGGLAAAASSSALPGADGGERADPRCLSCLVPTLSLWPPPHPSFRSGPASRGSGHGPGSIRSRRPRRPRPRLPPLERAPARWAPPGAWIRRRAAEHCGCGRGRKMGGQRPVAGPTPRRRVADGRYRAGFGAREPRPQR